MMARCSCIILATVLLAILCTVECIQLPLRVLAFFGDMFDKQIKQLIAFNNYTSQRKDFMDDFLAWSANITNSSKAEDKRLFDNLTDQDTLAYRMHDDLLHKTRAPLLTESLRNMSSQFHDGPINVALQQVEGQYSKVRDALYHVAFLVAEQANDFQSDRFIKFKKTIFDLGLDYTLSTGKFFNPVSGLYIIVHLTVMGENMGHVNIWVNDRIVAAVYNYGLSDMLSTVNTISTVWLNHGDLVYPKVSHGFNLSNTMPEKYRTVNPNFFSAVLIYQDRGFG